MGLLSTNEELASYKLAKVSVLKSGRKGESANLHNDMKDKVLPI